MFLYRDKRTRNKRERATDSQKYSLTVAQTQTNTVAQTTSMQEAANMVPGSIWLEEMGWIDINNKNSILNAKPIANNLVI